MIDYYRSCLNDPTRIHAYRKAIQTAIRPGDTVLDLGCGLGTYAMFAAQAGAKKVYAIDPNPIIYTAMELAKTNGFHKTIHFFRTRSEDFQLPERVDWIVTEFFGPSAADLLLTPTLADATSRFLKPRGRILPQAVCLYVVPVEGHSVHRKKYRGPYSCSYGLDFSKTVTMMTNYPFHTTLKQCRRLAPPCLIRETRLPADPQQGLRAHQIFHCMKNGTIHGFGVWFDLDFGEGIRLSTSPASPPLAWQQLYLPLERPIPVKRGSQVFLDLMAEVGLDGNIWWRWQGHRLQSRTSRSSFSFSQNSFRSGPLPPTGPPRLSNLDPLTVNRVGQEVGYVLSRVNGCRSLEDIAKDLQAFSPSRYPTQDRARQRIAELTDLLEVHA